KAISRTEVISPPILTDSVKTARTLQLGAMQHNTTVRPGRVAPPCGDPRDNITAMATPEDCRIVGNALRGLCGTLQQLGKTAWDTADRVFLELELPEDDHKGGRAHLARHVLRRDLRRATDLDGWHLPHGCTPNGELKLCRDAMTLKILRPGL